MSNGKVIKRAAEFPLYGMTVFELEQEPNKEEEPQEQPKEQEKIEPPLDTKKIEQEARKKSL
ncbi:hypothetical protein MCHI_002505 [Candidatus Magnetoovum chiemensis]|nr:hypothetical protein MCHI_002505 [Candidatus Magnetoovum chiemensis]